SGGRGPAAAVRQGRPAARVGRAKVVAGADETDGAIRLVHVGLEIPKIGGGKGTRTLLLDIRPRDGSGQGQGALVLDDVEGHTARDRAIFKGIQGRPIPYPRGWQGTIHQAGGFREKLPVHASLPATRNRESE